MRDEPADGRSLERPDFTPTSSRPRPASELVYAVTDVFSLLTLNTSLLFSASRLRVELQTLGHDEPQATSNCAQVGRSERGGLVSRTEGARYN